MEIPGSSDIFWLSAALESLIITPRQKIDKQSLQEAHQLVYIL